MSDPHPKKPSSDVLTTEEEVTLRRVAFGESPARTLRANACFVMDRRARF